MSISFDYIKELNDSLQKSNDTQASHYNEQKYPLYLTVAQPRAASILFQQIVVSNLDMGYISGFLAKFYKAPLFGLFFEKDLVSKDFKSNFLSEYGNTFGFEEPHEWGWFWQHHLGLKAEEHYSEKKDLSSLRHNINAIIAIKNRPLIIDNVFAMSNIDKLKEIFDIRIVYTKRDLYYICNSIINARVKRYGDITTFFGHRPKNVESILRIKNPIEQIVVQVKSIQNEIDAILESFSSDAVFVVDYEEIYHTTYEVVEKFYDFVKNDGIELQFKERHLPKLSYRNDPKLIDPRYKEDLDLYYKKYFGNSMGT